MSEQRNQQGGPEPGTTFTVTIVINGDSTEYTGPVTIGIMECVSANRTGTSTVYSQGWQVDMNEIEPPNTSAVWEYDVEVTGGQLYVVYVHAHNTTNGQKFGQAQLHTFGYENEVYTVVMHENAN